jgi:hypothetical protein
MVGLLAVAGSLGCATQTTPRSGFYMGVGWNAMTADFTCSGCTLQGASDPWEGDSGGGGHLRLGGSVSESLLLGGEVGLQMTGQQGRAHVGERSSESAHLLFTGQYYPGSPDGLWVTGAVGPAHLSLVTNHTGSHQGAGFMTRVGLGYDWHPQGRFSVTPHVNLSRLRVGDITTYGSVGPVSEIGIEWMAQLGLGLNWY